MFQLIERAGERKAVYSKSDLEYMIRRGWKPVVLPVAALLKPKPEVTPIEPVERVKRKYTRKQ